MAIAAVDAMMAPFPGGHDPYVLRDRSGELLACADHFNAKPKKGLAYMQDIGVLTAPLCATQVAAFLKHAPGLDKAVAGEYLGDHHEFNVSVLGEYVR